MKQGKPKSPLYCVCRMPDDHRFMIQCDVCKEWFHGRCIGINATEGRRLRKITWFCPKCDWQEKEKVLLGKIAKKDIELQSLQQLLWKVEELLFLSYEQRKIYLLDLISKHEIALKQFKQDIEKDQNTNCVEAPICAGIKEVQTTEKSLQVEDVCESSICENKIFDLSQQQLNDKNQNTYCVKAPICAGIKEVQTTEKSLQVEDVCESSICENKIFDLSQQQLNDKSRIPSRKRLQPYSRLSLKYKRCEKKADASYREEK